MGEVVHLDAAGPAGVVAWLETPDDARRGGLVMICEDGPASDEVRALAAAFAAVGYETLAPALFYENAAWNDIARDVCAAVSALAAPVFVMGWGGWGGAAAWLAACRVAGVAAVSACDGARIAELVSEAPTAPIILHFGVDQRPAPAALIGAIGEAHPDIPMHLYDAMERSGAARLAHLRDLRLFALNGVGRGDF